MNIGWNRMPACGQIFNITTGIKSAEIEKFKRKSVMKTYYQKAGIPTARWCVTADVTEAQAFAKTVGWPVIAKPDNGVGQTAPISSRIKPS